MILNYDSKKAHVGQKKNTWTKKTHTWGQNWVLKPVRVPIYLNRFLHTVFTYSTLHPGVQSSPVRFLHSVQSGSCTHLYAVPLQFPQTNLRGM